VIKTFVHPVTGQTLKLGRKRPKVRYPRLSLRNYLMLALPSPPDAVDYSASAEQALSQMYDNDTLGDCVIAAMAHLAGVFAGNAGATLLFTDPEIVALYSAIGGYVPGDPSTDDGCDVQTALTYWQNNGLLSDASHKIAGWLAVDPSNVEEIKTAIWLFENLVFGVELPDAWTSDMPSASGFEWDVAGDPDPAQGHCFAGVGYSLDAVTIDTWGMEGAITLPAIAKYAASSANGELYVVLSADSISKAKAKAPNGFDWSQLVADFDSMGGRVSA